jgi:hypothetical protein
MENVELPCNQHLSKRLRFYRKKGENSIFSVQSNRIIEIRAVFCVSGAINFQRDSALYMPNLHRDIEGYLSV